MKYSLTITKMTYGVLDNNMADNLSEQCIICSKATELKRCGRCKVVFYCSRQHQIQDWSNHKMTCSILQKRNQNTPTSQSSKTEVKTESENDFYEFDQRPLHVSTFDKPPNYDPLELSKFAHKKLKVNGFCVIDGILSDSECKNVKGEIIQMCSSGFLKTGKLAGGKTSGIEEQKVVNENIRSDQMAWLDEKEADSFPHISDLVRTKMDVIVAGLNMYSEGEYCVQGKTKVFVLRLFA